jgi:hypothetical protein
MHAGKRNKTNEEKSTRHRVVMDFTFTDGNTDEPPCRFSVDFYKILKHDIYELKIKVKENVGIQSHTGLKIRVYL